MLITKSHCRWVINCPAYCWKLWVVKQPEHWQASPLLISDFVFWCFSTKLLWYVDFQLVWSWFESVPCWGALLLINNLLCYSYSKNTLDVSDQHDFFWATTQFSMLFSTIVFSNQSPAPKSSLRLRIHHGSGIYNQTTRCFQRFWPLLQLD